MPIVTVQELIDSGVHFGHRVGRWNPKMAPYIFGKRNLIHIINLRETLKGLIRGHNFLSRLSADGRTILFVGTKRQAKNVVEAEAKRCGMPYVTERWLGGTLTNFRTIRSRLKRLEEIEQMETTGHFDVLKKKEVSRLLRERRKLTKNLQGIRTMEKLPGAIVIIDPTREKIAIAEASKLGIPTVALIDTDGDPDKIDIGIPGNDDAMRSIQTILRRLSDAVIHGTKAARMRMGMDEKARGDDAPSEAPSAPSGADIRKTVLVKKVAPAKPEPAPAPAPEPAPEPAPAPETKPESNGEAAS